VLVIHEGLTVIKDARVLLQRLTILRYVTFVSREVGARSHRLAQRTAILGNLLRTRLSPIYHGLDHLRDKTRANPTAWPLSAFSPVGLLGG